MSVVIPWRLWPVPRGGFMRAFRSFIHQFIDSPSDLHKHRLCARH